MVDDGEIWVIAPKGFRPSNWVDMLRDFDVAFELDPYLIDPGFIDGAHGHREEILVIRLELLDAESVVNPTAEQSARHSLYWEMLDRVASLGLQISFPTRMATEHADAWATSLEFCRNRKISFANR